MGLKLEVGKYYKTRDGRTVGPMKSFNGVHSFHCDHADYDLDMEIWEPNGTVYMPEKSDERRELVEAAPASLEAGQ